MMVMILKDFISGNHNHHKNLRSILLYEPAPLR